jgi:DNA polymerase-3 subunit gamma/tau
MFLLRLIHIKGFKPKNENQSTTQEHNYQKDSSEVNIPTKIINKDTINQIKNVSQEKKIKLDPKIDTKVLSEIKIQSFSELVDLCASKKEMKLKYELEKNVNLVKFENCRIEISFNDNLDKDFVKNLSTKLLEWTNERWIISFSKNQGEMSIKEKEKNKQKELIESTKKTDLYKTVMEYFPDAELIEVRPTIKDDDK